MRPERPLSLLLGLLLGLPTQAPGPALAGEAPETPSSAEVAVPDPDLTHAEAPVAAQITERRERVFAEPTSAEAWGRLGMALDIHDLESEAAACYRRALELDEEAFRWAYYLAILLAEQADPAATEAFERARALRPSYGPLLVRYGDLEAGLGRADRAQALYRAAVEDDGDGVAHGLTGLARQALDSGELDRALAFARDALANDPRHGTARGLLAEIHRRRGETEEAEKLRREGTFGAAHLVDDVLVELMDGGVSSYWHHQRSRAFLAGRRFERAEAEARAALALSPSALFHQNLARVLIAQERTREAEEELHKAIELAPDLAASHSLLGRLLERTGRQSKAIEALRRAVTLRPDSEAARRLGQILLNTEQRAEGLRLLRRSLERDEDPRILLAVAWVLATAADESLRDPAAAEAYARRLLQLTRHQRAEPYDALGAALAAQGRFEEAIDIAEKAVETARGHGSLLVRTLESRLELYRSGKPFIAEK